MQETAPAPSPAALRSDTSTDSGAPSDHVRALAVKGIVALGMLAGMILSATLWLSAREYPHTPVWDGLPSIPAPFDRFWLGGLLGLLVGVALLRGASARIALCTFVGFVLTLAMWDQSRWQPWAYQYALML